MQTIEYFVGRLTEYAAHLNGATDQRLIDMRAGIANRRALAALPADSPAREVPQTSINAEAIDLFS
jgi:hypothetical protein